MGRSSLRTWALAVVLRSSVTFAQDDARVREAVDGAAGASNVLPRGPSIHADTYVRPGPRPTASLLVHRGRAVPAAEFRVAHPERDLRPRMGPPRLRTGAWVGAGVTGFGLALVLGAARSPSSPTPTTRRTSYRAPAALPSTGSEVRRVSVGLRSEPFETLQRELAASIAGLDARTAEGRFAFARAYRDALAGAHAGARYLGCQSFSVDGARAQEVFSRVAEGVRGRGTVEALETFRRGAGPMPADRAEDASGFVVVTLVVAVKGALPAPPSTVSLPALMAALDGLLPARSEQLAAFDAVWSPSEDRGCLSAAEVDRIYPELLRLDSDGATQRRACPTCRAVVSARLHVCPACGAG